MNSISAMLTERMASLVPKTTASACIPASPWTSTQVRCNATDFCCTYARTCHHECNGATECNSWTEVAGTCRQYT